jgi:hypothetical protein
VANHQSVLRSNQFTGGTDVIPKLDQIERPYVALKAAKTTDQDLNKGNNRCMCFNAFLNAKIMYLVGRRYLFKN